MVEVRALEHRCEKCGSHRIGVLDSRPVQRMKFPVIRRRRRCRECGHRWTTYEVSESQFDTIKKLEFLIVQIETMAREAEKARAALLEILPKEEP